MKRVCPEHGPLNDGVDFCRWAECSHNYGEPVTDAREWLDHLAGTTIYVNGAEYSADMIEPLTFVALRAVLDLHSSDNGMSAFCNGCDFPFPCPTVRIITTALDSP
jgi:hypothetical protein